jgi:hypothetical protein
MKTELTTSQEVSIETSNAGLGGAFVTGRVVVTKSTFHLPMKPLQPSDQQRLIV